MRLRDIYIGGLQAGYARGRDSAIDKQPVTGPVRLGRTGLAGDVQADQAHHGGPERALLQYCSDHYAHWRQQLPDQAARFLAPGFGENLSMAGMDETGVRIGDVYRIGRCRVQVSQPRSPCWKLNVRFGVPDMAERVQAGWRCGWFYRVLEGGELAPGDTVELLEAATDSVTVADTMAAVHHGAFLPERLERLAGLDSLSPNWRDKARRRLQDSRRPGARARLYGID